jgi:O-methyltransferase
VRRALRFRVIHQQIPSAHFPQELHLICQAILDRRVTQGDVAEFGCFKGGSTAKMSIACRDAGKRLLVFDSFEGLPEPEEWDAEHKIERPRTFKRGEYSGALDEVHANVSRLGEVAACEFIPGWFSVTVPSLDRPLSVVFADVDLCASLDAVLPVWDLIEPRGILFVHDATDPKLRQQLERWSAEELPAVARFPNRPPATPLWTLAAFEKA